MTVNFAKAQIHRLAGKHGWPFEAEAQSELARVALGAQSEDKLREIITEISEQWDHVPDARELRQEIQKRAPAQNEPVGCAHCTRPESPDWIEVAGGVRRCHCARGQWLGAKDRERQARRRGAA